jgi:hypothetical protein
MPCPNAAVLWDVCAKITFCDLEQLRYPSRLLLNPMQRQSPHHQASLPVSARQTNVTLCESRFVFSPHCSIGHQRHSEVMHSHTAVVLPSGASDESPAWTGTTNNGLIRSTHLRFSPMVNLFVRARITRAFIGSIRTRCTNRPPHPIDNLRSRILRRFPTRT